MNSKNIPNDVIHNIMNIVINSEKNLKLDYETNYSKIISKKNKSNSVEKKIRFYLLRVEWEEKKEVKKKIIIKLFDYLIVNSYFLNKRINQDLAKVVKSKIKELIKEIRFSDERIDIELTNKLNESNQKLFGLKKLKFCNNCNHYVCSLKHNYNLCFNHLTKKFSC